MEETVKQGAVIQEEIAELFINGEDTVAVWDIDKFKGHRGGALHGVEITAGRTEAAVAAERDEFQPAAVGTAVHGAAERGVTTVDHFIYVINNRLTWM